MTDTPEVTTKKVILGSEQTDIDPGQVEDNVDPNVVADATARVDADDDGDGDDKPAVKQPNPRNDRMKAIADRLKARRAAEDAPEFTGDYSDMTQVAGNVAKPPPEPEPQKTETTEGRESGPSDSAAEKRKFKLKVRHEEKELSEDEVLALAQKAAAADSYFEEGKRFFDEAKRARDQSRSASGETPHQETDTRTSDTEGVPEPIAPQPHQADEDTKKLIEDIQFGADPDEVAKRLDALSTKKAREEASRALIQEKMTDDFAHTMQVFKKVKSDNADLFADPNAEAVMERMVYDGYREDLKAIGVPEDRVPKKPGDLADWHRFYRVKGYKVRAAEKLIGDVKDRYVTWRGGNGASTKANTEARETQPRVVVDRGERRASIPTQPTRSTASPPAPPSAAQNPRSRRDVLAGMRKARGQV